MKASYPCKFIMVLIGMFLLSMTLTSCSSAPDPLDQVTLELNTYQCTDSLEKNKTDCIFGLTVSNSGNQPVHVSGSFVADIGEQIPSDSPQATYMAHELMHSTELGIQVTKVKVDDYINPNDSMDYDVGFVFPIHTRLRTVWLKYPATIKAVPPQGHTNICVEAGKALLAVAWDVKC